MKRFSLALTFAALAAASAVAGPAVAGMWDGAGFMQVQQSQKGRPGTDRGAPDRGGREARQERHDERRDRMTEDDRRSLHRDLDKANRELYGRRGQK